MSTGTEISNEISEGVETLEAANSSSEAGGLIILFMSVSLLVGCIIKRILQHYTRIPVPFTCLLLLAGLLAGIFEVYSASTNAIRDSLLLLAEIPPNVIL
jgi:F0F1-type ATP synthase assembly protein I